MQNKNNITIRDIADRVGVSKTTISRYLNGKYQYMSKETQQRIKKEIECANFRPNKLANSLKTFKSGLIGLVLSDMTAVLAPYIIGSVSTTAAKYDKQLIVVNTNGNPEHEISLVNELLDQQVEGLLAGSGYNSDYYLHVNETRCPVVLTSRVKNHRSIDSVYINHSEATELLIEHLIASGFKRILIVSTSGHDESSTITDRERTAEQTCQRHSGQGVQSTLFLIENNKLISLHGSQQAKHVEQIQDILQLANTESQKEKTAIFIAATVLMGEFLCGCYQQGIPLSDRFTIAGYDTYHFSPFATSPISVIEQPIIEVGKLATERLLEQISAQGALPIQEIILKCKLSLR